MAKKKKAAGQAKTKAVPKPTRNDLADDLDDDVDDDDDSRGSYRYSRYGYFPPSKPRAAKGGIKAHSRRGSFGENWWAKRWLAVLESVYVGGRLTRGRAYARKGQVTALDIESGRITAKVQGSAPRPYVVEIRLVPLTDAQWQAVADALASEPMTAAQLLAGEMPESLEAIFNATNAALFPTRKADWEPRCSCPDGLIPCKHIAAVCYLVAESLDRDPFLLFKLRGQTRDDFLARLGPKISSSPTAEAVLSTATDGTSPSEQKAGKKASAKAGKKASAKAGKKARGTRTAAATTAAAAVVDAIVFWRMPAPLPPLGEAPRFADSAALLRRLGPLPLWRSHTPFTDAFTPLYAAAMDAESLANQPAPHSP